MAKKQKNQKSEKELMEIFKELLQIKNTNLSLISNDIKSVRTDEFTNYKFEDFYEVDKSIDAIDYSYYCYCLHHNCRYDNKHSFYTLRISDIEAVDGKLYLFICPAYKTSENMALKKKVEVHNRLGLTPGKVVDIDDLKKPEGKLSDMVWDKKLKKLVPKTMKMDIKETKKEVKEKHETAKKQSAQKISDEMINNTDEKIEGQLHSSDFLPPKICTRLWTLNRGSDTEWSWYIKDVEGSKTKVEYYARPNEVGLENFQYDRGGSFLTKAYLKSEFPMFEEFGLSHLLCIEIQYGIEKPVEALNSVIDMLLIDERKF